MPRSRSKSPPRFTRDAERLIALSLGLNASGSLTEDRYWETEMSALMAKLLANGNDATLDGALDHLYQANLGAYDTLIELVESESESLVVMQRDLAWQALLIAAPIVAWSKYSIPSGPIAREDAEALQVQLQAHVLSADAKLVLVPYLQSIDQLPRHFSELRRLAARLADCAITGELPRIDFSRLPETANLLADTRFVVACVVAPRGKPLFRWQELGGTGHASRSHCLEQWIAQGRPNLAPLLTGCVFECLLPEAYFVSCREADRHVRPYAVRAAVSYLENALHVPAGNLRAVIGAFGGERVDEYRIGFSQRDKDEVVYGVVWPLYGREDENAAPGPLDDIRTQLKESGVTDVVELSSILPPEYCDDCGAPLFPDAEGEVQHAEMPEEVEENRAHFH
jgi:uncharacterized protein YuzB (UPF0349 family)